MFFIIYELVEQIKPCAMSVWGIYMGLTADLTQKRAYIDVDLFSFKLAYEIWIPYEIK